MRFHGDGSQAPQVVPFSNFSSWPLMRSEPGENPVGKRLSFGEGADHGLFEESPREAVA